MQVIGRAVRHHALLSRNSTTMGGGYATIYRDANGKYRRSYIRVFPGHQMAVDELFLYDMSGAHEYVRLMDSKALMLAAGYGSRLVPVSGRMWHWRYHGGKAPLMLFRGMEAMNLIPASAFAEIETRGQHVDRDLRYRAFRAVNHYDTDITRSMT